MRKRILMTMIMATMVITTACGGKGKDEAKETNAGQIITENDKDSNENKSNYKIEGNIIEEDEFLRLYDTGYLEIINDENRDIHIRENTEGYDLIMDKQFDKLVISAGTLKELCDFNGKNFELYIVGEGNFEGSIGYRNKSITKIYIDSITTEIRGSAFSDCENLEEVYIGSNVTRIGKEAFRDCNKLKKVTLNEGLVDIEENAFYSCKTLVDVALPKTVKTIGKKAFYWTAIKEIEIPAGVEEANGFTYCTELEKVTFNEGLRIIGQEAFFNCRKLKEIKLPKSLTEIGNFAFRECKELNTVVFQDSPTLIMEQVFDMCVSLENINFPETLTGIGWYAFDNCDKLTKVVLPKSLESKVDPCAFDVYGTEVEYK